MKKIIIQLASILVLSLIHINSVLAGPGGKIARELFDSPIGKIILTILFVVFLPLIIYINSKQFFTIRKTRKNLKALAHSSPHIFDELNLKNRLTDIVTRVHKSWSNENMEDCSEFMSTWYWQNQQLVHLDKWKENNLQNICRLKRINSMKPIHVRISNAENYEGSRLIYKIDANMEDYLINRDTKKVIEGKKGYNDVQTIWSFVLDSGSWKVDNIESSEAIMDYLRMENIVPARATA